MISDAKRQSALNARKLGSQALIDQKQERIRIYNLDPKRCAYEKCDNPIHYEKQRTNKFCSKSCAAKHNMPMAMTPDVIKKRNEQISKSVEFRKQNEQINCAYKKCWYYNIYQKKLILLDSDWEKRIAILLDSCKIEWIRPDPILWIDSKGITHRYFADFYLPKLNIYLDPKNKIVLKRDAEKLSKVTEEITLIYGDVKKIEVYVLGLS